MQKKIARAKKKIMREDFWTASFTFWIIANAKIKQVNI